MELSRFLPLEIESEVKTMQEFVVIGIQNINFKNNDGVSVIGTNLFLGFKDENAIGLKAQKFFLKEDFKLPDIKPNDKLRLTFDMKGRIIEIQKI